MFRHYAVSYTHLGVVHFGVHVVFLPLFQREQFIEASEDVPAHVVGAVKFDIQRCV